MAVHIMSLYLVFACAWICRAIVPVIKLVPLCPIFFCELLCTHLFPGRQYFDFSIPLSAGFVECRAPPRVTFGLVVVSLRALDSHPFFPSHVVLGRCFLSAAAAGAPASVVSTFTEPSGWCAGAVLDVAVCAVCASAAPSSWRTGVVPVVVGVV